jgi:hypothetical protein
VAGWAAVVVLAAFLGLGLVVVAVVLGSGSHDDDGPPTEEDPWKPG